MVDPIVGVGRASAPGDGARARGGHAAGRREPGVVELQEIYKSFGGNAQVLQNVSVQFAPGEVHGLVGQNGAGKSTLGKILGGVHRPDSGRIVVNGLSFKGWTTRQALAHGIATIQQELSLVPERSVEENIFLGIEEHRSGILRPGLRKRFEALEAQCALGLDPAAKVADLRIADRQKVEIMRAIARQANVIVMDEPTSSLTADEVARLHDVIDRLRAEGRTIIYVTHSIDSILSTCDSVTILRDGRLVRTTPVGDETPSSIITAMLGRATDIAFKRPASTVHQGLTHLIELQHVRARPVVADVSLHVDPGEVVGLAGLIGAGRTEVGRLLCGLERIEAGTYLLDGEPFAPRSIRVAMKRRLVMIPEDRKREGLISTQTVQRNVALSSSARVSKYGIVSSRAERRLALDMSEQLSIRPPNVKLNVSTLSGGNQQKVLFAKWMTTRPRFLVLDEPTRGVDVGARLQIYELIRQLTAEGAGILLISSDLDEVMGMSNRVYLIREGRTIGEVDPLRSTMNEVLHRLFDVPREPNTLTEGVVSQ